MFCRIAHIPRRSLSYRTSNKQHVHPSSSSAPSLPRQDFVLSITAARLTILALLLSLLLLPPSKVAILAVLLPDAALKESRKRSRFKSFEGG